MTEIMNKLYYMVEDQAGRELMEDEETKNLERQKFDLQDEVIRRLGEGGEELLEELAGLDLKLETIHDKALFRAAISLGTEMAQPRRVG